MNYLQKNYYQNLPCHSRRDNILYLASLIHIIKNQIPHYPHQLPSDIKKNIQFDVDAQIRKKGIQDYLNILLSKINDIQNSLKDHQTAIDHLPPLVISNRKITSNVWSTDTANRCINQGSLKFKLVYSNHQIELYKILKEANDVKNLYRIPQIQIKELYNLRQFYKDKKFGQLKRKYRKIYDCEAIKQAQWSFRNLNPIQIYQLKIQSYLQSHRMHCDDIKQQIRDLSIDMDQESKTRIQKLQKQLIIAEKQFQTRRKHFRQCQDIKTYAKAQQILKEWKKRQKIPMLPSESILIKSIKESTIELDLRDIQYQQLKRQIQNGSISKQKGSEHLESLMKQIIQNTENLFKTFEFKTHSFDFLTKLKILNKILQCPQSYRTDLSFKIFKNMYMTVKIPKSSYKSQFVLYIQQMKPYMSYYEAQNQYESLLLRDDLLTIAKEMLIFEKDQRSVIRQISMKSGYCSTHVQSYINDLKSGKVENTQKMMIQFEKQAIQFNYILQRITNHHSSELQRARNQIQSLLKLNKQIYCYQNLIDCYYQGMDDEVQQVVNSTISTKKFDIDSIQFESYQDKLDYELDNESFKRKTQKKIAQLKLKCEKQLKILDKERQLAEKPQQKDKPTRTFSMTQQIDQNTRLMLKYQNSIFKESCDVMQLKSLKQLTNQQLRRLFITASQLRQRRNKDQVSYQKYKSVMTKAAFQSGRQNGQYLNLTSKKVDKLIFKIEKSERFFKFKDQQQRNKSITERKLDLKQIDEESAQFQLNLLGQIEMEELYLRESLHSEYGQLFNLIFENMKTKKMKDIEQLCKLVSLEDFEENRLQIMSKGQIYPQYIGTDHHKRQNGRQCRLCEKIYLNKRRQFNEHYLKLHTGFLNKLYKSARQYIQKSSKKQKTVYLVETSPYLSFKNKEIAFKSYSKIQAQNKLQMYHQPLQVSRLVAIYPSSRKVIQYSNNYKIFNQISTKDYSQQPENQIMRNYNNMHQSNQFSEIQQQNQELENQIMQNRSEINQSNGQVQEKNQPIKSHYEMPLNNYFGQCDCLSHSSEWNAMKMKLSQQTKKYEWNNIKSQRAGNNIKQPPKKCQNVVNPLRKQNYLRQVEKFLKNRGLCLSNYIHLVNVYGKDFIYQHLSGENHEVVPNLINKHDEKILQKYINFNFTLPVQYIKLEVIGGGFIASRNILKDQFMGTLSGYVCNDQIGKDDPQNIMHYCSGGNKDFVVSSLNNTWSVGIMYNASVANPNMIINPFMTKWGILHIYRAKRNIMKGQHLVFDYDGGHEQLDLKSSKRLEKPIYDIQKFMQTGTFVLQQKVKRQTKKKLKQNKINKKMIYKSSKSL